jgi:transposase
MTRLRGRAPRGKRLYASAPQSHWYTTTMICSMRWDGSTACMAVDGATDTEVFRAYVQEVLCPTLRTGDVVIMDNLSPHKSTQTIELIQQVGAQVLFLPPYSPDLNPVEKMWSKLKEFLRSKEARSLPTLIEARGKAFPQSSSVFKILLLFSILKASCFACLWVIPLFTKAKIS